MQYLAIALGDTEMHCAVVSMVHSLLLSDSVGYQVTSSLAIVGAQLLLRGESVSEELLLSLLRFTHHHFHPLRVTA